MRLSQSGHCALAAFRYEPRRFLRFSEEAARAIGLEPRQHKLLAVRGMPAGVAATVGAFAERPPLRQHSAVELVDRSEARRLASGYATTGWRCSFRFASCVPPCATAEAPWRPRV